MHLPTPTPIHHSVGPALRCDWRQIAHQPGEQDSEPKDHGQMVAESTAPSQLQKAPVEEQGDPQNLQEVPSTKEDFEKHFDKGRTAKEAGKVLHRRDRMVDPLSCTLYGDTMVDDGAKLKKVTGTACFFRDERVYIDINRYRSI